MRRACGCAGCMYYMKWDDGLTVDRLPCRGWLGRHPCPGCTDGTYYGVCTVVQYYLTVRHVLYRGGLSGKAEHGHGHECTVTSRMDQCLQGGRGVSACHAGQSARHLHACASASGLVPHLEGKKMGEKKLFLPIYVPPMRDRVCGANGFSRPDRKAQ